MTDKETAVLEILRQNIRLVTVPGSGEVCERCESLVDYTYRVKEGCLERCAELIVGAFGERKEKSNG